MQEKIYTDKYGNRGKLKYYKNKRKKKYKLIKKLIAIGLSLTMVFGIGKLLFKDDKNDYVNYETSTTTSSVDNNSVSSDTDQYYNYSIESGDDDAVQYRPLTLLNVEKKDIETFKDYLNNNPVKYTYEGLYNIDKAYNSYKPKNIATPSSSILVVNGKLDANALYKKVLENNEKYYNDTQNNNARSFYNELDDEEIKEICNLIAKVINYEVQKEGVNILDVCKNLEHLKIFEGAAQLNNAIVNENMCFLINKRFIEGIFKTYSNGRNTYEEVIIHEIMHFIQSQTSNLNIEDGIEMGPFVSYADSTEVNPLNLTWILESNAEVEMSEYTGSEITTYSTQVGYLNTVNLALSSSYSYDTNAIYTIGYEKDWNAIYDLFGAKTDEEKKTIMKCLYSIEVSQVSDDNFYNAYMEKYGVDIDDYSNSSLKREVKKTCAREALLELTHIFYRNMCDNMNNDNFYLEDAFYLIRLWEADLLYHTEYNLEEQYLVCKDFIDSYNGIQEAFFKMIADSLNCSIDNIYDEYKNYSMKTTNGDNYALKKFDSDKKNFLLEIKKERYKKGNPRISSIDDIMQNKKELTY